MLFNNARHKLLIVIFIINHFMIPFLGAQTRVSGKVTDIQTFEPVVFANVVFRGTTIGIKTGFDGTFVLSGNSNSDSVIVSFIGYETRAVAVIPGIEQVIDIQLHPALYSLSEITVRPGENPAITLLKKVWKNMPDNHIKKLTAYQYENYSRSTIYVRKTGYYKKTDNRYLKPFSPEFDEYSIKTGNEDIPAIPSYFTETLSDHYFDGTAGREYVNIRAARSEGLAFENTSLPSQLITKQENLNFMDNTVIIIDKSFISPLSVFGKLYYKYYLADTLFIGKRYCYEVNFVPRSEEGPVFHGSFWINDSTYALKRISVELGQKAEVNFIRRIKIQQEYEPADSAAWFPVQTRIMADAANLFITNYSGKTNIVVNQLHEPGFYSSELKINPGAEDFEDEFWKSTRSNLLEKSDSLALQKLNLLKKNRKLTITARLIETAIKGYYNFGKFETGPYLLFYNHNDVEGNRFRIGGRTNIGLSKKLIFEGYAAYGLKDKRLKGSIQTEYFLSKEKWTKAGIQLRDDIENAGSLDEFYSGSSFLTFAGTFGGSDKMARSRLIRTWIESDLFNGLRGMLVFTDKTFEPAGHDFYFAWYQGQQKNILKSSYQTSEAGVILRYQPKAVYVFDGMRRFPVNFNQYPVFSFEFFRGFRGLTGGDFNYSRLVTGISQKFNPGGLGSLSYNARFTKVFGALPYPLLTTFAGNRSFFRTDRTYNLMNYGEFIADEALELFLSYHLNSLIIRKIPLLNKLELRTVFTANAAFGSFDEESNGFYDPGSNPQGILPQYDQEGNPLTMFNTLSYSHPYAEFSYGIENIFKFFRVDLVHRLTYLDNPDVHRFALKFSGVFRF